HREGQHVGGSRLVHPLDVQVRHDGGVDEDDRQLRLRVHPQRVEHEAAEGGELRLVDLEPGLVVDLDAHRRCLLLLPGRWSCGWRPGRCPFATTSHRAYASMMSLTRRWRTTSDDVRRQNSTSSTPSRMSSTERRPDCVPPGRSTCVASPVMTIFEPKPRRVRNIFICSVDVFCASSSTMNESLSERPRM